LNTAVKYFAGSPLRVTLEIMRHSVNRFAPSRTQSATAVAALLMAVMAGGVAWSQSAPPPSSDVQAPVAPAAPDRSAPLQNEPAPPPPEENPGLINEMGKLFEKSLSILPPIKSPSETIDDLNARAKDAGESLSRLAKPSSMATGRMGCPVAANGAPDCKAGADKLCQAKGYKEGKSLTFDSSEKCSAKVYMPGYKRQAGDCHTDYFVTRALCQ
jgi:hypothetical protein